MRADCVPPAAVLLRPRHSSLCGEPGTAEAVCNRCLPLAENAPFHFVGGSGFAVGFLRGKPVAGERPYTDHTAGQVN